MEVAHLPKVGVGLLVFHKGKLLLGKRKGSHGQGEYAGLGGHLEHGESFEDCAKRETKEECGIEITNIRFLCLSNIKKYTPKHYIDVGLIADWESGEARVLEPDRIESWDWYDLDNIPGPLFGPLENYFDN